ncbi:MAG: response regulator, partial [Firmicutes bacterium]|nr:response regulator [Bacillota bacterium]
FRADERKQKLYVNIDDGIPRMLVGDDQRLAQVVTNLLTNAVKFTPEEGSIHINARLQSEENGVCRLQISVADTGIGITAEQKTRLFRSFEQAEAGTTRKYGGTGLGLTISKHIVELMGGEIWVESEPGRGAEFIFTVNLLRGPDEKKRLLDDNVDWRNIRIFVVDDESEIRDFFVKVCTGIGVACQAAASGEEALRLLPAEDNYDVYFIDWKLPGINGVDLARQIQANKTRKSVVTIFSSADWSLIEDDARSAGVNKFLPKPLFPSTVVETINDCMGFIKPAEFVKEEQKTDDFSGHTILLAEDVELNREIVLTLLEPTELAVECAENGTDALAMFEAAPDKYDMIFMDVQMPEMDGYEATRRIRALGVPTAKSIPIIAMTANVFREDVEKCLNAGMNGHIGKPIDIDKMLAVLKTYLEK